MKDATFCCCFVYTAKQVRCQQPSCIQSRLCLDMIKTLSLSNLILKESGLINPLSNYYTRDKIKTSELFMKVFCFLSRILNPIAVVLVVFHYFIFNFFCYRILTFVQNLPLFEIYSCCALFTQQSNIVAQIFIYNEKLWMNDANACFVFVSRVKHLFRTKMKNEIGSDYTIECLQLRSVKLLR